MRLEPFADTYAQTVARWVGSDAELFWLAPATAPPITPEKIIAWSTPADRHAYLLWLSASNMPIGYAELGRMSDRTTHMWLGHFLLSPAYRGQGLSAAFLKLLLAEAREVHGARRVALVVFPANMPAVRCYQREGFVIAGYEHRRFDPSGKHHRMLRMDLDLNS